MRCWIGFFAVVFQLSICIAISGGPHRLVIQGNKTLAIVGRDGSVQWQMPWNGIHDIHVLGKPETKRVVWTFDQFAVFGNSVPNSQILDVNGKSLR